MSYWIFTVTDRYYENSSGRDYWTGEEVYRRRVVDKFWGITEGIAYTKSLWIGHRVVFYIAAQQILQEQERYYEGKYFAATCTLDSIYTCIYEPNELQRLRMGGHDPWIRSRNGVYLRNIHLFQNPVPLDDAVCTLDIFRHAVNIGGVLQGSINPIGKNDFERLEHMGNPI